jgi:hypothetical protein
VLFESRSFLFCGSKESFWCWMKKRILPFLVLWRRTTRTSGSLKYPPKAQYFCLGGSSKKMASRKSFKSSLHEAFIDCDIPSLERIIIDAPDSVLEGASPILIWFSEHENIEESDHAILSKLTKFKAGNPVAYRQSEYIFLLKFTKYVPCYELMGSFERLFPVQRLNFVRTLLRDLHSKKGAQLFVSTLDSLSEAGQSEFASVLSTTLVFDADLVPDLVKQGMSCFFFSFFFGAYFFSFL